MQLGFVTALPDEASSLTHALRGRKNDDEHLLDQCGVGEINATAAAHRLAEQGVDALVSWGTAGALEAKLAPGTLLVYDTIYSATQKFSVERSWHARLLERLAPLSPRQCSSYCVTNALDSASAKLELGARTRCAAVDMESAAIASVATAHSLPFAVIRVVVDPASFSIPACASAALADDGTTKVTTVLRGLMRHPSELGDLLRLARWYGQALRQLKRAADLLQPDFAIH